MHFSLCLTKISIWEYLTCWAVCTCWTTCVGTPVCTTAGGGLESDTLSLEWREPSETQIMKCSTWMRCSCHLDIYYHLSDSTVVSIRLKVEKAVYLSYNPYLVVKSTKPPRLMELLSFKYKGQQIQNEMHKNDLNIHLSFCCCMFQGEIPN